jgi:hypothetical protein
LKGIISNAFCFPISVLHRSEMVCKTVLNSKSCNVLSVMDIIKVENVFQQLTIKMARVKVTKYAIHIARECVIFVKNLLYGH